MPISESLYRFVEHSSYILRDDGLRLGPPAPARPRRRTTVRLEKRRQLAEPEIRTERGEEEEDDGGGESNKEYPLQHCDIGW